MKYTKELHEHVKKCADPKHEYTEIPTEQLIGILDELERLQESERWHKYPDEKPKKLKRKLISCKYPNRYSGKPIQLIAQYVPPKTVLADDFLSDELDCENVQEYDEEKDCYWVVEGWWECSEEAEYNYQISGDVIEWRDIPLPSSPEVTTIERGG